MPLERALSLTRTRESDPNDATQVASPHCANKEKVQGETRKSKVDGESKSDEEPMSDNDLVRWKKPTKYRSRNR